MNSIVSVQNLSKTYASGFVALKSVSLEVKAGEILALLGPNGAGKTTLISIICGTVNASSGKVLINGLDNVKDYRETRTMVGLVPQEINLGMFDKVWHTVAFSRGLHGKKADPDWIKEVLIQLSLYDKKDSLTMELSGGMKRRVLIAKALSHKPGILFLDEPSAGVDVELRKDMWRLVEKLRQTGVTIILTTHYIEEAEKIADRIGIIDKGELVLIENKIELMKKMGKKQLVVILSQPITTIPKPLASYDLILSDDGLKLTYQYNANADKNCVADFLQVINNQKLAIKDVNTKQSSLEDIFVSLVEK